MTKGQYMPQKVRRPREEMVLAANQIKLYGCEIAGSYRREKETIGDLDILVPPALDFGEACTIFETLFAYEPIRQGALKSEGIAKYLGSPLLLNLWRVPELESWAAMMLFATGPYDLNIMMRAKAKSRGWTLSQYGLFDENEVQLDRGYAEDTPFEELEKDIFEFLGLQALLPVEREDWRRYLLPKAPTKDYVYVRASNGVDRYAVVIEEGRATECDCRGFAFRRKCRHLAEGEKLFKEKGRF